MAYANAQELLDAIQPATGGTDILDPATGELVGRVAEQSAADLDSAVAVAKAAQPAWDALGHEERKRLLNAAAELPAGEPGRAVVRRHKEDVEALLSDHLEELLPDAPGRVPALARHLAFLLEGSMARAGLEGDDSCILEARRIAATLIGNL